VGGRRGDVVRGRVGIVRWVHHLLSRFVEASAFFSSAAPSAQSCVNALCSSGGGLPGPPSHGCRRGRSLAASASRSVIRTKGCQLAGFSQPCVIGLIGSEPGQGLLSQLFSLLFIDLSRVLALAAGGQCVVAGRVVTVPGLQDAMLHSSV